MLTVLRSPLLNVPPTLLENLMPSVDSSEQSSGTVWEQLTASTTLALQTVAQTISHWHTLAMQLPLHDVLDHVIRSCDAVTRYTQTAPVVERTMAQSHWTWVLNWALNLNQGRFPSLAAAIADAERLAEFVPDDKDTQALGDAVRIMTVHGSKGLEAEHVWLVSACGPSEKADSDRDWLTVWPAGVDTPVHMSLVSSIKKPSGVRKPWIEDERQAYLDEADHLLYVALTRARRCVHVSGFTGAKTGQHHWYGRLLPSASLVHEAWPHEEASGLPTTLAESSSAHWQPLPALPTVSVGELMPDESTRAQRQGIVWHAAMQFVNATAFDDLDAWWGSVWHRLEPLSRSLDEQALGEVRQSINRVLADERVRPLLSAYPSCQWVEWEWMVAASTARADRVVLQQTSHDGQATQRWVLMDFKWSVNEDSLPLYRQQLERYKSLIESTLMIKHKGDAAVQALESWLITRDAEIIPL